MRDSAGERRLGNLASITAAIEATSTKIRSVEIQSGSELYEARVQVAIPLNRVSGLDRARMKSDRAEFVDNELRLELVMEIRSRDRPSVETAQSTPKQSQPENTRDNSEEIRDQSDPQLQQPAQRTGSRSEEKQSGETETAPVGDATSEPTTEPDDQTSSSTESQGEIPKYQDPEQLAAVYDEDTTFEEMRQALDVEVTAQTVRKYMIKHGIHEPEPRPDRLLETIRAAELELMNSEEGRRPRQVDSSASADDESS
ncbi:hypothetical protein PM035_14560 [Halorubrum ezzemoulense]|uniref:hypothetical protein n=1 Tax=Halorubrum ezzemoulense TaxID=337243 RepID=UPI002330EA44|nr:hypothetical protein [Halorubrum ezzemoulense]MDB2262050.1 hypothetical protein [Halorubrum ezzemoulense]MDB2268897.1 hypothetical protein [Halorubrum ezzemoulense]